MNDGAKKAYLDRLTEVIKARVAKSAAGARVDFHNQIESWHEKEPVFKQKMEDLRLASADGFEAMKSGAESVWKEISSFMNAKTKDKNDSSRK